MAPSPIWDFSRFREKDRASALCELQDWVAHTLTERHKLGGGLPDCWTEHPPLVEALVELHEWEVEARHPEEISRWREAAVAASKHWALACGHDLSLEGSRTAIATG